MQIFYFMKAFFKLLFTGILCRTADLPKGKSQRDVSHGRVFYMQNIGGDANFYSRAPGFHSYNVPDDWTVPRHISIFYYLLYRHSCGKCGHVFW